MISRNPNFEELQDKIQISRELRELGTKVIKIIRKGRLDQSKVNSKFAVGVGA